MDLPNLLNKIKHKEEPPQRFLAVEIGSVSVKSAVWQVVKDETQIVAIGSLEPYESQSDDDLISAIDQSLGNSLAGLDTEPNQVIFGLPETWASGDNIAGKQKATIKKICDHLALKPIGFVVTTEAMARHLADTFGGPPSLILLNLSPSEIAVSLVILGKIEGTQVVRRSQSIVSDVAEGLARFPQQDNLPARFLLFDSREDLDALKQELIAHDWLAHLPFLHFPKIESLGSDATIKAIALSGGAEVARSLGYVSEASEITSPDSPPLPKPTPPSPASDRDLPHVAAALGFKSAAVSKPPPPLEALPAAEPSEAELELDPSDSDFTPVQSSRFHLPSFAFIGRFFTAIKNFFHRFHFSHKRPWLWLILVVIFLGFFYAYYFLPKAEVDIYFEPQTVSKDVSFTVAASATSSAGTTIGAAKATYEAAKTSEANTTGTITVGDKATGKVTVYNRTISAKTLPKNTVLQAENLKFLLNEEIKLASASTKENPDFSITLEPAKADTSATAAQIGTAYNVSANTKFTVANFGSDSVIASAVSAFSGGSSQEVAAVSKSDQVTLQAQAEADLTQSMTTDLVEKSTLETKIVTVGKPRVKSAVFSAKVGEPEDKLTLDLEMTQDYYQFKLNDVLTLINQSQSDIPAGMVLAPHLTNIQIKDITPGEAGNVTVNATLTNVYTPDINPEDITPHLRGRPPKLTETYLHTLPRYQSMVVRLHRGLPEPLGSFPLPVTNFIIKFKIKGS